MITLFKEFQPDDISVKPIELNKQQVYSSTVFAGSIDSVIDYIDRIQFSINGIVLNKLDDSNIIISGNVKGTYSERNESAYDTVDYYGTGSINTAYSYYDTVDEFTLESYNITGSISGIVQINNISGYGLTGTFNGTLDFNNISHIVGDNTVTGMFLDSTGKVITIDQVSPLSIDTATNLELPKDFVYENSALSDLNPDLSHKTLLYNTVNQLYYKDETAKSLLNMQQADFKGLSTINTVIKVPRAYTGESIQPNSVSLTFNAPTVTDYVAQPLYDADTSIYDQTTYDYLVESFNASTGSSADNSITIQDDGNGNLYYTKFATATLDATTPIYAGNVVYNHGMIVISDPAFNTVASRDSAYNWNNNMYELSFRATHTIYENEYFCTAKSYEFNASMNPGYINSKGFYTGKDGKPISLPPFITKIGLYNADGDCVLIAKLPKPILKSQLYDTTFVVRYDS